MHIFEVLSIPFFKKLKYFFGEVMHIFKVLSIEFLKNYKFLEVIKMAFCEVEKVDGYTIMANYHLRDSRLSLKAKGLLSLIFSLPPDWDMSIEGLAHISLECSETIGKIIKELEKAGYITRSRERRSDGTFGGANYYISQKPNNGTDIEFSPKPKKPVLDSPIYEIPTEGTSGQLNKDKSNKEELNKDLSINPADAGNEEIRSDEIGLDETEKIRERIHDNIDYDVISEQYDKSQLDEIVEIMVECVATTKTKLTIGKEEISAEVVRSRYLKINSEHIEYIMWSLHRNTSKIRNIKSYLRTVIYNAPTTISNFYAAEVNHDMHKGQ